MGTAMTFLLVQQRVHTGETGRLAFLYSGLAIGRTGALSSMPQPQQAYANLESCRRLPRTSSSANVAGPIRPRFVWDTPAILREQKRIALSLLPADGDGAPRYRRSPSSHDENCARALRNHSGNRFFRV